MSSKPASTLALLALVAIGCRSSSVGRDAAARPIDSPSGSSSDGRSEGDAAAATPPAPWRDLVGRVYGLPWDESAFAEKCSSGKSYTTLPVHGAPALGWSYFSKNLEIWNASGALVVFVPAETLPVNPQPRSRSELVRQIEGHFQLAVPALSEDCKGPLAVPPVDGEGQRPEESGCFAVFGIDPGNSTQAPKKPLARLYFARIDSDQRTWVKQAASSSSEVDVERLVDGTTWRSIRIVPPATGRFPAFDHFANWDTRRVRMAWVGREKLAVSNLAPSGVDYSATARQHLSFDATSGARMPAFDSVLPLIVRHGDKIAFDPVSIRFRDVTTGKPVGLAPQQGPDQGPERFLSMDADRRRALFLRQRDRTATSHSPAEQLVIRNIDTAAVRLFAAPIHAGRFIGDDGAPSFPEAVDVSLNGEVSLSRGTDHIFVSAGRALFRFASCAGKPELCLELVGTVDGRGKVQARPGIVLTEAEGPSELLRRIPEIAIVPTDEPRKNDMVRVLDDAWTVPESYCPPRRR